MNILLVTSSLPYPADTGARIRAFNLLRCLSSRHKIVLLTLAPNPPDEDTLEKLRPFCRRIEAVPHRRGIIKKALDLIGSYIVGRPYVVQANTSPELRSRISQLIEEEQIELIQVEELYCAANFAGVQVRCPLVFDAYNCEGLILKRLAAAADGGLQRLYWRSQARKLSRFEQAFCARADCVFCVSPLELPYFEAISRRVKLIPNGAPDLDAGGGSADNAAASQSRSDGQTLLFAGTLSYPPNSDGLLFFLREIWPQISAARPSVRFDIIGRNPPAGLRRAAAAAGSRVRLLTAVGEVAPYFRNAAAAVVPLRAGGGTRIKILEAFSAGVPVVSTPIGAEGIEAENGRQILIAESPDKFSDEVLRLLRSPDLAQSLAQSARELVLEKYNWPQLAENCCRAYVEISASAAGQPASPL